MPLDLEIKTEKMTSGYFMESGQKVVCLLKLATECYRRPSADLGGYTRPISSLGPSLLSRGEGGDLFFPTAEF